MLERAIFDLFLELVKNLSTLWITFKRKTKWMNRFCKNFAEIFSGGKGGCPQISEEILKQKLGILIQFLRLERMSVRWNSNQPTSNFGPSLLSLSRHFRSFLLYLDTKHKWYTRMK